MTSLYANSEGRRPLIGCTTYRKQIGQSMVVGVTEAYTKAIIAAGGIPVLIPLCLDEAAWRQLFNQVDGLLLPGGGDIDFRRYSEEQQVELRDIDSQRDELELALTKAAVAEQKPFLAICRGHQVFNVAMGGTLWQDVRIQMPGAAKHDFRTPAVRGRAVHTVTVEPDSKIARYVASGTIGVNSIHHQGVRDLAPGLVITARAEDGLIEGIEIPEHPFAVGVQWHPEAMLPHPQMLSLFEGFIKVAGNGHI